MTGGYLARVFACETGSGEALALHCDEARAMRWAAVWAVGEACETWRSDSDELQALVASAEFQRLMG